MTWTYGGDPSGNARDRVRFLVGDTDSTDQLLSDEEIAWLLSESPNHYIASANACDQIAAQFTRQISRRSQDENPETIDKMRSFQRLARQLRNQAARRSAVPFAGGISIAQKETEEDDTDRVKPKFTTDLQENPNTSNAPTRH